jgi:ribonuclease Z
MLTLRIKPIVLTILIAGGFFVFGRELIQKQVSLNLVPSANAAGAGTAESGWSPTKPYPGQEVYYPGTEELGPDEIQVIACGSGMPMPRTKQAAACFLPYRARQW